MRASSSPAAPVFAIALVVAIVGCHSRYAADAPVKRAPEACCKLANEGLKKFAGCRMTHRCRNDEPIWLRGAVTCSAVDENSCAGGRCCELEPLYGSPDAVLNWDEAMQGSGGDTRPEEPGTAPPTTGPAPSTNPPSTP